MPEPTAYYLKARHFETSHRTQNLSVMKKILILTALFASTNFCFSQSAASLHAPLAKAVNLSFGEADESDAVADSQAAIAQIKAHVVNNMEYPELMIQYGIEGTVVVGVSISEDGQISKTGIVRSPSQQFDSTVLEAM